jgi:cyclophilin family peptidyl-prolyl cis-trans isomerase
VELFSDEMACPKTCMSFLGLCNADAGKGYKGTKFHRVVENGWIQGGDILLDGKDAPEIIPDESFMISFGSSSGMLGLANEGDVHTNRSQFFVTLKPMPSLDGKYVAIGRIISGFGTVQAISSADAVNEAPVLDCVVKDCGVSV